MARPKDDETHIRDLEATGASKEGVVRYVLIFGTLITILLLSAVWIIGAATQGPVEEEATVSGKISAQENDGSDTDSIVMPEGGEIDDEPDTIEEDGLSVVPNE